MIDDEGKQDKEESHGDSPIRNQMNKPSGRNATSEEQQHPPQQPGWRGWYQNPAYFSGVAVAVFTLILTLTSLLQWQVTQGQLDAMKRDQRPWVNATVEVVNAAFDDKGGHVSVRITITNVGHSPATRIMPRLKADPFKSGAPLDLLGRQREACEEGTKMLRTETSLGDILFPGESKPIPFVYVLDVPKAAIDGAVRTQGDKRMSMPIAGCVLYGPTDPLFETGLIYMLWEIDHATGAFMGIDPTQPFIEGPKLALQKMPVGSYAR